MNSNILYDTYFGIFVLLNGNTYFYERLIDIYHSPYWQTGIVYVVLLLKRQNFNVQLLWLFCQANCRIVKIASYNYAIASTIHSGFGMSDSIIIFLLLDENSQSSTLLKSQMQSLRVRFGKVRRSRSANSYLLFMAEAHSWIHGFMVSWSATALGKIRKMHHYTYSFKLAILLNLALEKNLVIVVLQTYIEGRKSAERNMKHWKGRTLWLFICSATFYRINSISLLFKYYLFVKFDAKIFQAN